ncbi:hypothetical protein AGABI1DRAFT_135179 [Agaricus bisporus var. burnettii JB137-S8]|uniref:Uncharacterized protein n=1 Tax=Agaricus bisporus var. burnettii (strain JB137-S8 / ATCC MYA-4627 / FGSC 10392) TaxID=597362 RepID=K5XFW8_AGABU|nr:uncharacterized protein AGABI1DRAFT_135179 [Agaricus bisporus var. burnettii JB137-S8]EKM73275.1 hypothetical protein AGABI1DRAFT_135179 [Agaricus bisporus var. burnettii JB137-S8]
MDSGREKRNPLVFEVNRLSGDSDIETLVSGKSLFHSPPVERQQTLHQLNRQ